MKDNDDDLSKWAVENQHVDRLDFCVRLLETPQEWTAKAISDSANEAFKKKERPYVSTYFQIRDKRGKMIHHND